MRSRRRTPIVVLALALALASPAGALAQSAGDDQYSDPLAPAEPQRPDPQPQEQPADPPPQAAPTQSGDDAAPAAPAQDEDPAPETLPRTGSDVLVLLALAWPLLIGGVALLRVTARRPLVR